MLECGLDEAGRGPVIGPLVISVVCADPAILMEIGVNDSKVLSPSRREALYHRIKDVSKHYRIEVVTATTINSRMRETTLNEIEYQYFRSLIDDCGNDAYVDAFDVDEERLSNRLSRDTGFTVVAKHKGDQLYQSVMAASILSKVTRDRIVREISSEYGEVGSGYPSDPRTIDFLMKALDSGLDVSNIVRVEWKTWKELVRKRKQRDIYH